MKLSQILGNMNNKELGQTACLGSTLFDLTDKNVEEIYHRNYIRWQYKVSDTVIVNGVDVSDSFERALLQYTDKEGKPNIQSLHMSNTIGGIPAKEIDFIKEELNTQTKLIEKYSSDIKNKRLEIKRLEIYLEYLNFRKIELSNNQDHCKTGLAPKAGLTPEHFRKLYLYLIDDKRKWIEVRENSERDFLAIFSTDTLPPGWKPIKWLRQTKYKKPHLEILFNIMYRCFKNAKESYPFADNAYSYFVHKEGVFEKRKYKKDTGKEMNDIEKILQL